MRRIFAFHPELIRREISDRKDELLAKKDDEGNPKWTPEQIKEIEEMEFEKSSSFPFEEITALPDAHNKRGGRRKGKTYVEAISAFDIETTKIPGEELSVMFIWQWHISAENIEYTVLGRTWEEFTTFFNRLAIAVGEFRTLLCFDQNFNYELSYLKSVIKFTNKDGFTEIFSKDAHHPIYAMSHFGVIEWRDTAILFATKLEEATKGLPHHKTDEFDYTKKRFSWTVLTDIEYYYTICDVYGLCECVTRMLKDHGDVLYTLPYTSTGYIRRDVRKIMYPYTRVQAYPADSYEVYEVLRDCFRGGNTHASRFYALDIHEMVESWDRSSSYPAILALEKFPLDPFEPDGLHYPQHLDELTENGYAYIMQVKLTDVKLKNPLEPLPYQSISKCRGLIGVGPEDNGRLLSCKQMRAGFTDVDWEIFRRQYKYSSIVIEKLYRSKYGMLPSEFRDYIIQLYKDKTSLKKVKGAEDKYRVQKTKINGCFGLAVQKIDNHTVELDDNTLELIERVEEKSETEKIAEYDEIAKKRPLPYRVGVYTCAIGRARLDDLCSVVGPYFWYADTDSVKFLPGVDKSKIDELNERYIKLAKEHDAFAVDPKGNTHFMGAYEYEGTYERAVTMGSKKYAVEEKDKKGNIVTEITIAGCPKVEGAKELVKAGGLEAFKPGMVFRAGKLRPVYNDKSDYGTREVYDCDGKTGTVKVTSNACLVDTEYKLGLSDEYEELLRRINAGDLEAVDEFIDSIPETMSKYEYYMDKYNFYC